MKHQWRNDETAFGMPDLTYCKVCNTVETVYNTKEECPGVKCIKCLSPTECDGVNCLQRLPTESQPLIYRLRKRAEIRRQIPGRKSVEEGKADRIADLLEEAAATIESMKENLTNIPK
jgi:hypothetical protein